MAPPPFAYSDLTLDRSTRSEVAALAARSFFDDLLFTYLNADPVRRSRAIALLVRSHLVAMGDSAEATGARDRAGTLVGACVWQRPGSHPLPASRQVGDLLGGLRAMILQPSRLVPGLHYALAMEKHRPGGEHWYLSLLVSDPMAWRRGIGTALLESSLAAPDEEGLPSYLETQKEDNLAFYRRFGFEETERLTPARHGPPLFTMTRAAR